MANATAKVGYATTPVTDEKQKYLLVTTSQTYYNGAMLGWNVSGLLDKFDDAASLRFAGVIEDVGPIKIDADSTTEQRRVTIRKPRFIIMAIASVSAADLGRKVYAAYDNQVQFSPGTYGNYVGTVAALNGSSTTTVIIDTLATDCRLDCPSLSLAATGTITLTKDQLNRTVFINNTAAQTINLPAVAYTNAGDWLDFIKTTADAYAFTLDGNSSETINGSATLVSGVNRYERIRIISTGSAWIAQQTVLDDVTMNSITGGDSSLGITGQASGTGGSVSVVGGASSTSSAAGGAVTVTGGAGGASGTGGAVTVTGGSPASGNAAGGVASIIGGAGLGSGNGGIGKVVGGDAGSSGTGGKAQLIGGAGSGVGGAAEVTGGGGGGATDNGGAVTITGGASGGASATAGSVTISSGAASGGTAGAVNIQTATGGKIGFFNTSAIVQPSGNGTQATSAAGATGTVYLNTTLTGGVGSTAYTVGDVVKCLKQLGLITT